MPVDYSTYPPDWFDTIRPAVLKRDGYHCKKCGIAHRQHLIRHSSNVTVHVPKHRVVQKKNQGYRVEQVFLQVAHLDHDITNNKLENLLSMCPTCHNRYDAKNRAIKRRINKANGKKM